MPSSLGVRPKRRRVTGSAATNKGANSKDGLYHCDYCNKDLSTTLRIKCNVCTDFDLCLECFSVGVEIGTHQNNHGYRVLDSLSFPILSLDWGADEEMLLLEAVELFGLGNWQRISEHVGRPDKDCRQHYFQVYIETDTFPLPKPAANLAGVDIEKYIESHRTRNREAIKNIQSMTDTSQLLDGVKDEPSTSMGGTLPEAGAMKKAKTEPEVSTGGPKNKPTPKAGGGGGLSPHAADQQQAPAAQGGKAPSAPGTTTQVALSEAQQTGYHAKRDEFDPEYDYEAETIIAELEFNKDDTPEQVEKKLELCRIYNRRLDARAHRKQYVLNRGLINVKRYQSQDRKRSAGERELIGRLRVLSRYLDQPTFDSLAEDLVVEQRIRARIHELQQYRSIGLRTFMDVDMYEAVYGGLRKDTAPAVQAGKNRLNRINIDSPALETELAVLNQGHAALAVHKQHMAMTEGKGNESLSGWRNRRGTLLDLASIPDSEPLTQPERVLCSSERYLPAQMIAIKGQTVKAEATPAANADVEEGAFHIDPERSARLLHFFKQQ